MTAPASDRDSALQRLPFLSRLEPSLRDLVVGLFQSRSYAFGETIVAQGDVADGMYVLASGSARALVVHDGKEVTLARLQSGDWFGETALLDRTTRTATVRASEPVSALWLDRLVFDALLELHPEIRDAFGSQARVEMLHRFLRTHAAFEDLSLEAASEIYPRLRPLEVPAETVLVREGESGGTMYLIEQGRLEATTSKGDVGEVDRFHANGGHIRRALARHWRGLRRDRARGHRSASARSRPRGVPRLGEPVPGLRANGCTSRPRAATSRRKPAFRWTSRRKSCRAASVRSAPRMRLKATCRLRSLNASVELGGRRSSLSSSRSMRRTVASLVWR